MDISSEMTYNGKIVGGYPNRIKIGKNITEIHEDTLNYMNALASMRGTIIEVDSGNSVYELVEETNSKGNTYYKLQVQTGD